jgi:type II restriction enzyme
LWYQLKGQQSRIGNSITDGAYAAMMNAIRHDETPNFYFMHYDLASWSIKNLLLIPSFAFPPSAIIKRAPLSSTARRAGWVGCNIALSRIPIEARIAIVTESSISPESNVREKFRRVKPLKEISVTQRGWTLDVLNAIRRLVSEGRAPRDPNFSGQSGTRITRPSGEFTTADPAMRDLHPRVGTIAPRQSACQG